MMLFGPNGHPWKDWNLTLSVAAQIPKGMGIVRWDEQVQQSGTQTAISDVVSHYRQVSSYGLHSLIVLVPQPVASVPEPLLADYVALLAPALLAEFNQGYSPALPILQIGNEPNYHGWAAASYARALMLAWNAAGDIPISMAGLALNDQAYLTAMGRFGRSTNFLAGHFYTAGGTAPNLVGPLAPDDPDVAHSGRYSFTLGISQTQALYRNPLIVSEFGWNAPINPNLPLPTNALDEYQRASYMRAAVNIAAQHGVYALIAEEVGSGDTPADATVSGNLYQTPSWDAFVAAGISANS